MRILTTEKTGSTTTGTVGPKGSAYLENEKQAHEILFPDSWCGMPKPAETHGATALSSATFLSNSC